MASPHFITGSLGLLLLGAQAMLPLFFREDPSVRTVVRQPSPAFLQRGAGVHAPLSLGG
jgi:hypothetical protein